MRAGRARLKAVTALPCESVVPLAWTVSAVLERWTDTVKGEPLHTGQRADGLRWAPPSDLAGLNGGAALELQLSRERVYLGAQSPDVN